MKKKILIIVLLCVICIGTTSCSSNDWKNVKSDVRSSVKNADFMP